MKPKRLTQSKLKEILSYDPKTGVFIWKARVCQRVKIGDVAGSLTEGYIKIGINGKIYAAHRLAFLFMEGYLPENDTDHINGIKNDNRWCNLRHVAHQCNTRNCKIYKNNTTGVIGVNWDKESGKWRARIKIGKKDAHLGYFKEFKNAIMARWQGEIEQGYPACQTSSSAYLYLKKHQLLKEGE